jgi:hypothetical protein
MAHRNVINPKMMIPWVLGWSVHAGRGRIAECLITLIVSIEPNLVWQLRIRLANELKATILRAPSSALWAGVHGPVRRWYQFTAHNPNGWACLRLKERAKGPPRKVHLEQTCELCAI